jgi:hemerythrin superfamily protein
MDMQSALSGKVAKDRATDLLREDHQQIRGLCTQYGQAIAERWENRQSLAEEICMQLEVHSCVEEEIFYPAIERIASEFVAHAQEQHHALGECIDRIKQHAPDDPQYDLTMRSLMELFERHATEEEATFPLLEERVPDALIVLRTKIMQRKEQLTGSTREMEGRS